MGDMWKAGQDVVDTVHDLISKYHPHLLTMQDEIAIVINEKAGKAGETIVLGKATKAAPLLGVLTDKDYKFVLYVAADEWQSLNDKERTALLDHLLCACRVKEDKKTSALKPYLQPPPAYYKEEVERHGWWRTGKVAPPEKSLIEDIFGK